MGKRLNNVCDCTTEPLTGYSDLLTTDDMAEVLRVSTRTIYRLVDSGDLPSVRVGHRLYFPRLMVAEALHLGGAEHALQ